MVLKNLLRLSSAAIVLSSLTACQNYTVAPLCTDANSVILPGTAGFYTMSVQQDDYTVKTTSMVVAPAPETHLSFTVDGETKTGKACQIGGYNIVETYNDDVKGYQQERLYVTGMGLAQLPVFYDRRELQEAGIASKVFTLPKSATKLFSILANTRAEAMFSRIRDLAEDSTGLMIDNSQVRPEVLVAHSYAAPAGSVALRR